MTFEEYKKDIPLENIIGKIVYDKKPCDNEHEIPSIGILAEHNPFLKNVSPDILQNFMCICELCHMFADDVGGSILIALRECSNEAFIDIFAPHIAMRSDELSILSSICQRVPEIVIMPTTSNHDGEIMMSINFRFYQKPPMD